MQHQEQEQSRQTGTRNETYDVIAVLYHALQGAENCRIYVKDAEDGATRQFFEQAMQVQRQLADQGKQVLHELLMNQEKAGSSGSAFGWQSQPSGSDSFNQGQQSISPQGAATTGSL